MSAYDRAARCTPRAARPRPRPCASANPRLALPPCAASSARPSLPSLSPAPSPARLRRPSTKSAWRGAFSSASPAWTFELAFKAQLDRDADAAEKCFWISFEDFLCHFQSLYVCRTWDDTKPGWRHTVAAGAWQGPTAQGLREDVHLNPQFSLELQAPTSLILTLKHFAPAQPPAALYVVSRAAENSVRLDLAHYEALAERQQAVREEQLDLAVEAAARAREVNSQAQIADFGATFRLPARGQAAVDLILQSPGLRTPGSGARTPTLTSRSASKASLFKAGAPPKAPATPSARATTAAGAGAGAAAGAGGADEQRAPPPPKSSIGRESGSSCSPWDAGAEAPLLPATDGRVYGLTASNVVATSGAPASGDLRVFVNLPPGRYTVLCAARDKGAEGAFGLSVHATSSVVVSQLWPPTITEAGIAPARVFPPTRRLDDISEDDDEDEDGGGSGGSGGDAAGSGASGGAFGAALAAAGRGALAALRSLGFVDGNSNSAVEGFRRAEVSAFVAASNRYRRATEGALVDARAAFLKTGVPRTPDGKLLFEHRVFTAANGAAPEVDAFAAPPPEAAAAASPTTAEEEGAGGEEEEEEGASEGGEGDEGEEEDEEEQGDENV